METFTDRLITAIIKKRSILWVGLDPQLRYIPVYFRKTAVEAYGRTFEAVGRVYASYMIAVVDAVAPYAVAVKPQLAFWECYGHPGIRALEQVSAYARRRGLLVINDAKRGDGGDTAEAYAQGHLGEVPFWGNGVDDKLGTAVSPIRADALTVQPWICDACFTPFLKTIKQHGTGVFVVDKSSFDPNSRVEQMLTASGKPNWQALAEIVQELGAGTEGERGYRNFGVVMGATYPNDAVVMRETLPKSWFLVPGYGGPQGGGADGAVVGANRDGFGVVAGSARGIAYAYHPVSRSKFQGPPESSAEAAGQAAKTARDELNEALQRAGKLNW